MKENDTFYYVLKTHHTIFGKDTIDYNVFAYRYHKDLEGCFDKDLIFETQEEAEKKAEELNKRK